MNRRRDRNLALERVQEALTALPMDSHTRHWLEEDLAQLVDADRIKELEQEVSDLKTENYDLEHYRSTLEYEVYELRQRIVELEEHISVGEGEYEPGVD